MNGESCATCRNRLSLEQFDYSNGGCEHKPQIGFVCTALASEGVASWMVGISEEGICEMYSPRMKRK